MFTDHFEQAFCINLDRRPDRWRHAQKEFEKIGLEVERVAAVDGKLQPPASIPPGAVGCLQSHLAVFKTARDRGLKSFLMLEDDVVFDDQFHEKFNAIEPQIKSYEMLYFGSNPVSGAKQIVSANLVRITYTFAAHCVIFKESCYDDIIRDLSGPMVQPCDVHYGMNQVLHPAYSIRPALAWQRPDYSDIDNAFVDYDFLKV